jgi:hypothetical protein
VPRMLHRDPPAREALPELHVAGGVNFKGCLQWKYLLRSRSRVPNKTD